MNKQPFSWYRRIVSFRYAFAGLKALLRTEHNAWIHAACTIVAIALAIILNISATEAAILLLTMTAVWVTEIINTSIEKLADFISLENHPQIGLVKDLAAAAVLIAAVAAALIGTLIFLPKLLCYA